MHEAGEGGSISAIQNIIIYVKDSEIIPRQWEILDEFVSGKL